MSDSLRNDNQPPQQPLSLADNFHKYFQIKIANTKELRREVFKIRYEVYCDELGWEEKQTVNQGMEIDEFDDYSYYCLLYHMASDSYAGCVRVVIPPPDNLDLVTPFEKYCSASLLPDVIDTNALERGSFGELSRLAVPATFRRRRDEAQKPFILSEVAGGHEFSEEERRNFPNIAIGLYLAMLKVAQMCNHDHAFVMMEPKLNRRLRRFGLPFVQAGELIDYHGDRALFYITADESINHLNLELLELYQGIARQVEQQMKLIPYTNPRDRYSSLI